MSRPNGEEALKKLRKLCFDLQIKMVWKLPLAKGTYPVLRNLIPKDKISSKVLYAALCCHARSPEYLKCLRKGQIRLAPGGVKAGVVSAEEYAHAQSMLKKQQQKAERSLKIAAKIAAKRKAKASKAGKLCIEAQSRPLSGTTKPCVVITKKKRQCHG